MTIYTSSFFSFRSFSAFNAYNKRLSSSINVPIKLEIGDESSPRNSVKSACLEGSCESFETSLTPITLPSTMPPFNLSTGSTLTDSAKTLATTTGSSLHIATAVDPSNKSFIFSISVSRDAILRSVFLATLKSALAFLRRRLSPSSSFTDSPLHSTTNNEGLVLNILLNSLTTCSLATLVNIILLLIIMMHKVFICILYAVSCILYLMPLSQIPLAHRGCLRDQPLFLDPLS